MTIQDEETGTREPVSEDVDEPALEGSSRRRLAISALIVLTLLAIFASNAPDSTIKAGLLTVTRPFLFVTGLDQRWGMFAPNPPRETENVAARVDRADGTVGIFPMESGDGLTEYWNYRWRKYGEQLWQVQLAERERTAFARWVADQDRGAGHAPRRVTLIRLTQENLPPGPGPDAGEWREIPFFTMPVGAQ